MTGTDYNAIVNELNKPTVTVRPKAQPDRSHVAGLNQTKVKIRTGNGDDAHLWPAKRYVDIAPCETERDTRKMKAQNAVRAKRYEEERKAKEQKLVEAMSQTLDKIFNA